MKRARPSLLIVPTAFILVDHSIFRAFNKGTLGMLSAEGPQNLLVYFGKEVDATYLGDSALPGAADSRVAALESEMKKAIAGEPKIAAMSKEIFMEKGKRIRMLSPQKTRGAIPRESRRGGLSPGAA